MLPIALHDGAVNNHAHQASLAARPSLLLTLMPHLASSLQPQPPLLQLLPLKPGLLITAGSFKLFRMSDTDFGCVQIQDSAENVLRHRPTVYIMLAD